MRTIAVMNQKGGVGKTTTSVNLSAALAAKGHRVCALDLDPQGHTSFHFGVEAVGNTPTVYDIFSGERKMADVRTMVGKNLWIVPSNIDLAGVEIELARTKGREFILRKAMDEMLAADEFDYLIIDCPPSLGILTVNALVAVSEVFIPLQPHFFALQGLSKLFETTALVTRRLNRDLRVTGIIMCLYETGTRLAADVTDDLQTFLAQKIFNTRVRRNIKLAEAPSFGQSIFEYAPSSAGAKDYGALSVEIAKMQVPTVIRDTTSRTNDAQVRRAA
ncbi:UNVERIFIED_CONTAM: hypothetical protein GTU68_058908 [Idotea baltica]|nr:hypothetical protein [Idotea baltica]